jgi:hypothetical protein
MTQTRSGSRKRWLATFAVSSQAGRRASPSIRGEIRDAKAFRSLIHTPTLTATIEPDDIFENKSGLVAKYSPASPDNGVPSSSPVRGNADQFGEGLSILSITITSTTALVG